MNYKQKILSRIENFDSNQVFIANDFFDIAGYETVRSTLNRLVQDKEIIRIMKGIYYKPKYIELIGEYEAPSVKLRMQLPENIIGRLLHRAIRL